MGSESAGQREAGSLRSGKAENDLRRELIHWGKAGKAMTWKKEAEEEAVEVGRNSKADFACS